MHHPRVLLLGADWFADLLGSCRRGLEAVGAEVKVLATNTALRASRLAPFLARMPLVGDRMAQRLLHQHDVRQRKIVIERTAGIAGSWRPDLLLYVLSWGGEVDDGLLAVVEGAHKVAWLMDDPFQHPGPLARSLAGFDQVYTVDEAWVPNIRLAGVRRVRMLTCGADATMYRPVPGRQVPDAYHCDVVFVGSSYHNVPAGLLRRALLEPLTGRDLRLYGDPGWCHLAPALARCYQGRTVETEEANLIYNGARLVLNIHHPQFHGGTSLRTFAIAAAGACQLVDERPGIGCFYEPGREVVTYSGPDDLRKKVNYYLDHEDERWSVARAGWERTLAEHTFAHRLAVVLEEAGLPAVMPPRSTCLEESK